MPGRAVRMQSAASAFARTFAHRSAAIAFAVVAIFAIIDAPLSQADNRRLNNSVVENVYTVQHQAGCTTRVHKNPQLELAAQWHARDILAHRNLPAHLGSDGSSPQDRAVAAGFGGAVAQTVAINQSLAINNLDVLKQWYYDPAIYAIMVNCSNNVIGVWSENSLDRSVVVAVYGRL